ncbi:MAG: hypothetical protein ABI633_01915 [Burkholderiales bacterium]
MSAAQLETITLGGGCFWCLEVAYLLVDSQHISLHELLANYSRAEGYHECYFEQHPGQGDCAYVVVPKLGKVRHTFSSRVRSAA